MTTTEPYSESLTAHANRLKADIENCYNLLMEIRFKHVERDQLNLLVEVQGKCSKVILEIDRIIKEFKNE